MARLSWLDMLLYRLFYKRINRILASRPDLRELFIAWLKAYDVIDEGTLVDVTISISPTKEPA